MFNYVTLAYGFLMAIMDSFGLFIVKTVSNGGEKQLYRMIVPTLIYAMQPWVFLRAFRSETMTVMNIVFDLASDITVSLIGIFVFGEKISRLQLLGLFIGMIALVLLAQKEET